MSLNESNNQYVHSETHRSESISQTNPDLSEMRTDEINIKLLLIIVAAFPIMFMDIIALTALRFLLNIKDNSEEHNLWKKVINFNLNMVFGSFLMLAILAAATALQSYVITSSIESELILDLSTAAFSTTLNLLLIAQFAFFWITVGWNALMAYRLHQNKKVHYPKLLPLLILFSKVFQKINKKLDAC